jgi:hypothetical protein
LHKRMAQVIELHEITVPSQAPTANRIKDGAAATSVSACQAEPHHESANSYQQRDHPTRWPDMH